MRAVERRSCARCGPRARGAPTAPRRSRARAGRRRRAAPCGPSTSLPGSAARIARSALSATAWACGSAASGEIASDDVDERAPARLARAHAPQLGARLGRRDRRRAPPRRRPRARGPSGPARSRASAAPPRGRRAPRRRAPRPRRPPARRPARAAVPPAPPACPRSPTRSAARWRPAPRCRGGARRDCEISARLRSTASTTAMTGNAHQVASTSCAASPVEPRDRLRRDDAADEHRKAPRRAPRGARPCRGRMGARDRAAAARHAARAASAIAAARSVPECAASARKPSEPVIETRDELQQREEGCRDDREQRDAARIAEPVGALARWPSPGSPLVQRAASHASSSRAARPRWLIASFSADESSAIVRSLWSSSGTNDRVVAEAARAARLGGQRARAAPLEEALLAAARVDQRQRADVAQRAALRRLGRAAARGCRRRSRPSPAKRAERTPGSPPSAAASIPESSAIAMRPVAAAAARALRARSRRTSRPSRVAARPRRAAPRARAGSAAATARAACARCAWRAGASPCGLGDDRVLRGAQALDARGRERRAGRRGGRARAECPRRSPAPRAGRRRRSSRRWRRPPPTSPPGSRGRAAPAPSTIPHETAAIVLGQRRALDAARRRRAARSRARARRSRR